MFLDFEKLSSYAQFGEDLLAYHILRSAGVEQGHYLDIGCGHPIEFNNTYFFYKRGWSGVHVDASPEFASAYQKQRPEDTFLNLAVGLGSSGEKLEFFEFRPYFFSTCDPARAELLKADSQVEFVKTHDVPATSLSALLHSQMKGLAVDLLSIDVEGLELQVLKSNNWTECRPKLLIVEILGLTAAGGLLNTASYAFLKEIGYSLKAFTQSSFLFADTGLEVFNSYPDLPLGELR